MPVYPGALRLAEAERALQRGQAEAGLHGVGEFPAEHEPTEPIHDGDQIQEARPHRNIRNIGAPNLVGPLDRDAPQQVRIDLVARRRAAQVRFRIMRFDSQNPHQALHAFAVHPQRDRHPATAEERPLQIEFV